MPISCPNCEKTIPDANAGDGVVSCPHCRTEFQAPALGAKVGRMQPGEQLGGFEIVKHIASGGMGDVYLARQLSLNRLVALKTLSERYTHNDEIAKRFLLEVRATASLEHPGIVTLYEAGTDRGVCFLAMAYVDGYSLDRLLEAEGRPLDERLALRIARGVAEALDYAWRRQQLIHRDIKPANIMLDKDNQVRILDLGVAKRPHDEYSLAKAGMAIGTPHFMSPEQARGRDDLDFRTDIYSLGASLYHLVTNRYPYESKKIVEILTKHITEPPPDARAANPEVSEACAALIRTMMAKAPDDRYANWKALAKDINRVLAGQPPIYGGPAPAPPPATTPAGQTPAVAAAASPAATPESPPRRARPARLFHITALLLVLGLLLAWLAIYVRQARHPVARATPAAGEHEDSSVPILMPEPLPEAPAVGTPAAAVAPDLDESLRQAIDTLIEQGRSPLDLISQYSQKKDFAGAERVAWLLLDSYQGPRQGWAHGATRYLADYYQQAGNLAKYEEVLKRRLALGFDRRLRDAATAYRDLGKLYADQERWRDLEQLLWRGLREDRDTVGPLAAFCALQLVEFYQQHPDPDKLRECFDYALGNLPPQGRPFDELVSLAKTHCPDLAPRGEARKNESELAQRRTEVEYRNRALQDQMAEAPPQRRGQLLLQMGRNYEQRELYPEAVAKYRQALKDHGPLGDGKIGADALQALARCYQKEGREAEWVQALDALTEKPYRGADGANGARAARQLAAYYREQGNTPLAIACLKRIIDEFPGPDRQAAADASFEIASLYEKGGSIFLALGVLDRVRQEFPGATGANKTKAEAELTRLNRSHPAEIASVRADAGQPVGPFEDSLRFNGLNEFFSLREADHELSRSKALTVECWFRRDEAQSGTACLLSRYGNNNRGFNLSLQRDGLVWETCDGTQRTRIATPDQAPIPASVWTHVAATAGNGSMALFVNGRLIAKAPIAGLENDGAGRLRIGAASWKEQFLFMGAMQNVQVLTQVVYEGPFQPETKRENRPGLYAYVARVDGQNVELTRRHTLGKQ